jgi:hypothetical protein
MNAHFGPPESCELLLQAHSVHHPHNLDQNQWNNHITLQESSDDLEIRMWDSPSMLRTSLPLVEFTKKLAGKLDTNLHLTRQIEKENRPNQWSGQNFTNFTKSLF